MVPVAVLAALNVTAPPSSRPDTTLSLGSDSISMKHGASVLNVSLKCPRFVTDRGEVGGGLAPASVKSGRAAVGKIEASYPPIDLQGGGRLEVKLVAEWSPKERVMRKWARYRVTGTDTPLLVKEIVLEEIGGSRIELQPGSQQSYPAFLDGFFVGIEFPMASTRMEGERLLLAHVPGKRVNPGEWQESRKAVYGIGARGHEREAFLSYIAAHRPTPRGLHFNYNSWWTSPIPYSEANILDLMNTFQERLQKPHGESFDSFCIDLGWSDPKSLWQIDKKLFPGGFTKIADAAKRMGSFLGVWISPSACYPSALDPSWAAENGCEIINVGPDRRYACLGGEHYSRAFRERLVVMVTKFGVRQLKLDGYLLQCSESGHGHEPGPLSGEALAEGGIAAFEAVRKAAPDVWLETTCFGWNPSPWWLFFVNSVIGTYGDDAPHGRVPSPVYREAATTSRDYFNLQGAALLPIPIVAQEVLGIVHQTDEPLLNDAVDVVMRGHAFLSLYVNPAHMNERRYKQLSDVMRWARANSSILAETTPLLPRSWLPSDPRPPTPDPQSRVPHFTNDAVMPREPYGYAHWNGNRGLVCLRNPWIVPQSYEITLGGTSKEPLTAVSIYPEARSYGSGLKPGQKLQVALAPYETVVLSIAPKQSVKGLPDVSKAIGGHVQASLATKRVTRIEYEGEERAFGPDWTSLVGGAKAATEIDLTGKIVSDAPSAELLILLECKEAPPAPTCKLSINGTEPTITSTGSETGWVATGLPMPEHWLFLRAPLARGNNDVSLQLLADQSVKASVWIWATKAGSAHHDVGGLSEPDARRSASETPPTASLPEPELISLSSSCLLEPTELSSLTSQTERRARPVERISGVFLDSLDPVSVSQGWGTLQRNQSVWEKPMTAGGRRFIRGLGTHAPSRIVYNLDGKYTRFQAWAGADQNNSPSVTFQVIADGKKLWESGLVTREDLAKRVDVDVTGVKTLELIVGDGGNGINGDHADWADARLLGG